MYWRRQEGRRFSHRCLRCNGRSRASAKTEDAFPESADMGFALVGEAASYGWKGGRKWGLTGANKAPII